jgi:hypothetical protein
MSRVMTAVTERLLLWPKIALCSLHKRQNNNLFMRMSEQQQHQQEPNLCEYMRSKWLELYKLLLYISFSSSGIFPAQFSRIKNAIKNSFLCAYANEIQISCFGSQIVTLFLDEEIDRRRMARPSGRL